MTTNVTVIEFTQVAPDGSPVWQTAFYTRNPAPLSVTLKDTTVAVEVDVDIDSRVALDNPTSVAASDTPVLAALGKLFFLGAVAAGTNRVLKVA